jgi:hypothetical protein
MKTGVAERKPLAPGHDQQRDVSVSLSRAGAACSDPSIELAVQQLKAVCRTATLDFALTVGEIIVKTVYGGKLDCWRLRGAKSASFRKLAKHPELPLSAGVLYRSVAIYELCERFDVRRCRNVGISHIRLVLPFPQERQAPLLQLAETHGWSVRRMEEEISLERGPREASRGGRRRRSAVKSAIQRLEKCVGDAKKAIGENASEVSPESGREIIEVLRRTAQSCAALESCLGRKLPGL